MSAMLAECFRRRGAAQLKDPWWTKGEEEERGEDDLRVREGVEVSMMEERNRLWRDLKVRSRVLRTEVVWRSLMLFGLMC